MLLQRSILGLAILLAANCSVFAQQSQASTAPLEILKLKWQKQTRLPRNFDPSIIPTNGGFADPAKASSGTSASTPAPPAFESSPYVTFPVTPNRLPVVFVYSMTVKNSGNKAIDGVAWDYVFLDSATSGEVGRHQFLSFEKLGPYKAVTFKSELRSAPTRVLRAGNNNNKENPKFVGRAIIQCVLYSDDTTWRGPQASRDICALLKTQRDLRKKKHSE